MAAMTGALNNMFGNTNWKALAGPILIVMILAMMILPLPPLLLDLLFTFNIALGLIVGIPAFIAFNYFNSVINRFVLDVQESAAELIEAVTFQLALEGKSAETEPARESEPASR